jgi:hypothetical protein
MPTWGGIIKKGKKKKHVNDVLNDKALLNGVIGAMGLELIPDSELGDYKVGIKADDLAYVPFDYRFFGDEEKDSFMNWWSKAAYVNQQGGIETERLKRYRDYHFMNANSTEIMLAVETYRDEALATSIKAEDLIKIGVFDENDTPIKDLTELLHKEYIKTFADYHSDLLEGLIIYGDHFVPLYYKKKVAYIQESILIQVSSEESILKERM